MQTKKNPQSHIIQQPPLVINEDEIRSRTTAGFSLSEQLDELVNKNKYVGSTMSLLNFSLSMIICLIYLHRQSSMCSYDVEPIWKYHRYVLEEDEQGNLVIASPLEETTCRGENEGWYYISLVAIHVYFLLEYILRLLTQKYKYNYMLSGESLLDLITTVPFLVLYVALGRQSAWVQFFIMFDVMRLATYYRLMQFFQLSDTTKQLICICANMVLLIYNMASILQFFENYNNYNRLGLNLYYEEKVNDVPVNFFQWLFFVFTTISLVGYGSYIKFDLSFIFIMCLLPIFFIVLPEQCGELVRLFQQKSIYARHSYTSLKSIKHIVLMGTVSQTALRNFLEELFHEDHFGGETKTVHCVLLQPNTPEAATVSLMTDAKYNTKLWYIEGADIDIDFNRCGLHSADAIVILCDKFSYDAEHEDTDTILTVMHIKSYLSRLKKQGNTEITDNLLCIQLLAPESLIHYDLSMPEANENDQIVCIESLKLAILAKSCQCPGLVVLITNLIKSSGELDERVVQREDHEAFNWLYNYWMGKQYEIYRVQIPSSYAGRNFCDIVSNVYKDHGSLLFALEISVNQNKGDILLNPGDYKLPKPYSPHNKYEYYGYIIADDQETAEAAFIEDLQDNSKLVEALQFQALNPIDKAMIAAEFHQQEGDEDDYGVDGVENMEGEFLSMCQLTAKPVSKDDIRFETMEDSKLAQNHIIICGMVENIRHFVMPLRALHCSVISPIVILHEEAPPPKLWQQLSVFEQIYFVQGSPLQEKSYDRVNIKKAKQIVILTPNVGNKKTDSSEENEEDLQAEDQQNDHENLLDAKTLFKYNIIKKKAPKVKVVTELINHDNIAFLLDDPVLYQFMADYKYDQTPVFASGEVYLSSLMDSLICQAYYNQALITVLKSMMGEVKRSSNNDSKRSTGKDIDFSRVQRSNLYQMKVPKLYHDKGYNKLFDNLTTRRFMIPLGLYRTARVNLNDYKPTEQSAAVGVPTINEKSKEQENYKTFNYVVTNPDRDTKLQETDMVFVLARSDPGDPDMWDSGTNVQMFDGNQTKKMRDIDEMMLKPTNSNKTKSKVSTNKQIDKNLQMPNNQQQNIQTEAPPVADDGEMAEKKPETANMFGSKQQQEKFDLSVSDLMGRIRNVNDQVEELNFTLNRRNNKIVQDVSSIIHSVLHEAGEVTGELNDVRRKADNAEVQQDK